MQLKPSLVQVLESSISVSRAAYLDLYSNRAALPRSCFDQCELALFALIDDYEMQLEQATLDKAEPEPCLFPQPETIVVGSWATGESCPFGEIRSEFRVEVACDGVRGLDAVTALPYGGHRNQWSGRYVLQTGCTHRD